MQRKMSLTESLRNTLNRLEILSEEEYRGSHGAPGPEDAPLYDLTANGIYPEDIYSANGPKYYGSYMPGDAAVFSMIHTYHNKPNAPVKIYRAVPAEPTPEKQIANLQKQMSSFLKNGRMPNDSKFTNPHKWYDWAHDEVDRLSELPATDTQKATINPGDWVSIDRQYAVEHGQSALNGKYKIISKTVPAKQVFTNGDSIREWGWNP